MIEFHQVNKWYGFYHALRDITLHRNPKNSSMLFMSTRKPKWKNPSLEGISHLPRP
ncbi:protein of unknown function [Kyrpidia spormannii]|uniref:Uncharacterized protein n=2 Tax=Kyrpidia spormannii TaxID=2055160 RepID=A0ACA8ZB40_9BACL|nr:protein of unknown function [Kyrpidia spormannii]CAB3394326.1 protein of unknown function [Kyrpidia spormannii]